MAVIVNIRVGVVAFRYTPRCRQNLRFVGFQYINTQRKFVGVVSLKTHPFHEIITPQIGYVTIIESRAALLW